MPWPRGDPLAMRSLKLARTLAATVPALCLLIPTGANAASVSLSLSTTTPRVDEVVTLATSGSIEDTGALWIYKEPNGADCAGTQGNHSARVNTRSIDLRFPNTGTFNYQSQTTFDQATTYRICVYLYRLFDDEDQAPPRALYTTLVTVQPPPPPPDRDGDGVADTIDTCPDLSANTSNGCPADTDRDTVLDGVDQCPAVAGVAPSGCPAPSAPVLATASSRRLGNGVIAVTVPCSEACTIRASGTAGAATFTPATGTAAANGSTTVRLRLSATALRKVRASLRRRASVKARIVVRITTAGGTASSTKTVTVRR